MNKNERKATPGFHSNQSLTRNAREHSTRLPVERTAHEKEGTPSTRNGSPNRSVKGRHQGPMSGRTGHCKEPLDKMMEVRIKHQATGPANLTPRRGEELQEMRIPPTMALWKKSTADPASDPNPPEKKEKGNSPVKWTSRRGENHSVWPDPKVRTNPRFQRGGKNQTSHRRKKRRRRGGIEPGKDREKKNGSGGKNR